MYPKKPLTTGKIAEYCNVNFKTVLKWIANNQLKAYQLPSGSNRVKIKDFIAFLKEYDMPIPKVFWGDAQPRILVVDDEPNVVAGIKRSLRKEDLVIESASDGFEAGMKISNFKPDIVLLDIKMPRLDGYDVMKQIRDNPETEHIKIVVLSGCVDKKDKRKILNYDINGMVEKPFAKEELIRIINALLKRS